MNSPRRAARAWREHRYPTDTDDAQWAVIDPYCRTWGSSPAGACGRERTAAGPSWTRIFYVVDNGIKWRALPAGFPPHSTVLKYFTRWEKTGTTPQILDAFRDRVPLAGDKVAAPSAAVIDWASIRGAETVGRSRAAMTRARRSTALKRHIALDTMGLLLWVIVIGACVQDRDGAKITAAAPHRLLPAYPTCFVRWRTTPANSCPSRQHSEPSPDHRQTNTDERLPCPTPPLGPPTDSGLDHLAPLLHPRLRTPARPPRGHSPLDHEENYRQITRQGRSRTDIYTTISPSPAPALQP